MTRKNFGANGFYGPSPSQERTNQFLLGGNHRVALPDEWQLSVAASYRMHGDDFLYDVRRPAWRGTCTDARRQRDGRGLARADPAVASDRRG